MQAIKKVKGVSRVDRRQRMPSRRTPRRAEGRGG
jgi:hypothetical protein